MKVLVIEDDPKLHSFLVNGLRQAGCAVDGARDGNAGLDLFLLSSYDAAVVDLMLPGRDGLSLIREARARGVAAPILVLSAKNAVSDRVAGLQTGADDYLVKPFSFSELLARLQALHRRARGTPEPASAVLRVANLELDPWKREVRRDGKAIPLHAREFSLLEFLMRNPGRVASKTAILEHVYDYSFDPQTNVVDVLVHRLRKKIDEGFEPKLIHTLRGMGYVLRAE